jgi:acetate kinase
VSVLVLNAGSSTLKYALFAADGREVADGVVDHPPSPGDAVEAILRQLPADDPVEAVGHRVVHGGSLFAGSVRIDEGVRAGIARTAELAPLHNPPALAVIDAARSVLPGVPHVACFDTAFFADLPPVARHYPVPDQWSTEWGVQRYGFHGISHAYCSGRAAEYLHRDPAGLRLVTLHLGNGCSAAAVRGGRPRATTMGFTPLEGLMMGTRAGSVDPGVLLYALRTKGLTPDELDEVLNKRSGLLGVSGISGDYRAVREAARDGNERARLALDLYADRVRSAVGALAVSLGGLDALVFTAGVGENAADLREAACAGLECLGVRLDPSRNANARADCDVAADDSTVRVLVLHTREELLIAREVHRVASGGPG